MVINKDDIASAIRMLRLQDKCICMHSSVKSFGCQVEGGAVAIINAFLDESCTILVPAFTYMNKVRPPLNLRPARNGSDYAYLDCQKEYKFPVTFSTNSNNISAEDMGLLPYTLLRMPSRSRGYNPLNSFAAIGPRSEELVSGQTATDVYAPFRTLCELGGYVLLMGVGLDRATIIHYAEQVAGRRPFVRWANNSHGEPDVCCTGSCSEGFENFTEMLVPIERDIMVAASRWRCFPAREMVDICAKAMRGNPMISHCGDPNCARCNDAIAGGPVWDRE